MMECIGLLTGDRTSNEKRAFAMQRPVLFDALAEAVRSELDKKSQ